MRILIGALLLVALALSGCSRGSEPIVVERPGPTPAEETTAPAPDTDLASLRIGLDKIADGFEQPLFVVGVPGANDLVVLEKTGLARLVRAGATASAPFLDLTKRVSTSSEQGLLGMAFSPGYADNGRFYVNYTDTDGATVVSRFTARADRAGADLTTEEQLLRIDQPYANHNGGCVVIGPDGMLWIGMGDGGSGGDPQGNGQDPRALLGKMLRIDVGESGTPPNGEPYGIPDDSPFANPLTEEDAGEPEIWALGLRNPWRFSFDRETGDLWIGDVGQSAWEEIDFVAAPVAEAGAGALNFGWNAFEGTHSFPQGSSVIVDPDRFTTPVIEFDRAAGQSVTGGYVYRGTRYPALVGVYLYGDYGTGRIWGARVGADGAMETAELLDTDMRVVSFGEDATGELYLVDFAGAVYRLTAE
jgi:glucose/arabinose dehydrogenase